MINVWMNPLPFGFTMEQILELGNVDSTYLGCEGRDCDANIYDLLAFLSLGEITKAFLKHIVINNIHNQLKYKHLFSIVSEETTRAKDRRTPR